MRDVRKLAVFSLCFLIGLLSQWHPADDDDPVVQKIVVSSVDTKTVAQLPKCTAVPLTGRDVDELNDLRRRYHSLMEEQKRLIEYPGMSSITESERYSDLEWKMYELRRIYKRKFSQKSRAPLSQEPCSDD